MIDPYRNDVLFYLMLDERFARMMAVRVETGQRERHPHLAATAAVTGRACVRLGMWLQSLAQRPVADECAYAGAGR